MAYRVVIGVYKLYMGVYKVYICVIRFIWVFSNLIVSLSRTIQQYSPPNDQIMCELSVFPIFFRERCLKSQQNPGADFF